MPNITPPSDHYVIRPSSVRKVQFTFKCPAASLSSDSVMILVYFNFMDSSGNVIAKGVNVNGYYENKGVTIGQGLSRSMTITAPDGQYIAPLMYMRISVKNPADGYFSKAYEANLTAYEGIVITVDGNANYGGAFNVDVDRPAKVESVSLDTTEQAIWELPKSENNIVQVLTARVTASGGTSFDYTWKYDTDYLNVTYIKDNKDNKLVKELIFRPKKLGTTTVQFIAGGKTATCTYHITLNPHMCINVVCSSKELVPPRDQSLAFSKNGRAKYIGYATKVGAKDTYILRFSDYVDYIPAGAFANNAGLREVTLPYQCKEIGPAAFCWCANLETVYFNSQLERIDTCAFHAITGDGKDSKKGLKNFTLPSSLKYIGSNAFRDVRCNSLVIPAGVQLAENAFCDTGALKDVYLYDKTPNTTASVVFSSKKVHVPKDALKAYQANKAFSNVTLIGDL